MSLPITEFLWHLLFIRLSRKTLSKNRPDVKHRQSLLEVSVVPNPLKFHILFFDKHKSGVINCRDLKS